MDKADSVITTLQRAVSQIDAQERAEVREHQARLRAIAKRRKMVQATLAGMVASTNGGAKRTTQGVSQERLDKVIAFLQKHPEARQVDIATKTKLNTGSVSMALKRLSEAGRVEKADHKDDGSQVWVLAENNIDNNRELVLHAGDGAREGRRLRTAA